MIRDSRCLLRVCYRSRRLASKSFSPSQSENEISAKGNKYQQPIPMKSKSAASEDFGSIADIDTRGTSLADLNHYETGMFITQLLCTCGNCFKYMHTCCLIHTLLCF